MKEPSVPDAKALTFVVVFRVLRDVFKSHWKFICLLWAAMFFIGAVVIFSLPKEYRSVASILPSEKNRSPLNGLMDTALVASFIGTEGALSSSEIIMTYLKSRTLRRHLLENPQIFEFALSPNVRGNAQTIADVSQRKVIHIALARLETALRIYLKPRGPIEIQATTQDPDLSASMVTLTLDALKKSLQERNISNARRKREFVESLLASRKTELETIQRKLLNFDSQGNATSIPVEVLPFLERISELSRKKASYEMTLDLLKRHIPERKEEHAKIYRTLLDLEERQLKLEKDLALRLAPTPQSEFRPFGKLPLLSLEFYLLSAQSKGLEEVVLLLGKELEISRIDESSEEINFQIVDNAYPNDIPAWPPRLSYLFMAFILGGSFSITIGILALRKSAFAQSPKRGS